MKLGLDRAEVPVPHIIAHFMNRRICLDVAKIFCHELSKNELWAF